MNALAMPISSRTAADMDWVCFCAKSPRILDERSATSWQTRPSAWDSFWLAGCIPHDAISAGGAPCLARVVEIVQVGYRLAHGEESLVRVERPAEKHRQEIAGAALAFPQFIRQLRKASAVMRFELRHPLMRAAKGFAVRRKDQHVGGQLAVAADGIQEQPQWVALGIDRPHADVGRDRGEQHVSRDDHVQRLAIERYVLRRVAVANDGLPIVLTDAHAIALDDTAVGVREFRHQLGVAVAPAGHRL